MELFCGALRGMSARANIAGMAFALGAALWFIAAAGGRAQQNAHATDFTTTEYFPDQKHVKTILSGAEAIPRTGGLLIIKQLKLQKFNADGKLECVVTAPECIYDTTGYTASSAGPLRLENGDGKFQVAGEGFLWRQTNSFLTISNQVLTRIENGAKANIIP
jgi:hypothetical protein